MPKVATGVKAKPESVHNESLNDVLVSLSQAIASKVDLVQVIRHSLKSAVHFTDLVITRFNLQKGTYSFFLESCDLYVQDPDFHSMVLQEHPIADGVQDVIMHSEHSVVFNVQELEKEGILHKQFLEKKGIRSLAGMRLQRHGETVGTIMLLSNDEAGFSPGRLPVLEAVSHYFATAMLNIMHLEEIQERNNGNEILLSTSEAFSHIRKKEDLLPILKQQLERLSFYNDVAITRVDEDGKRFSGFLVNEDSTRVEDKDYLSIRNAHNLFPDGVYEIALHAETPVFYNLETIINGGSAPANIQFLYANGTRAMVGIPLQEKDKPIGVLFLFSDRVISFSPLQLRIAQGIGNQLASTVANLIAQERIQRQVAEIEGYRSKLQIENQYLREQIKDTYNYDEIIGANNGLRNVFQLVSNVAPSDSTVLLLGETGTGKELIATAIHNSSPRRKNLLVKINCAAMPAHLVESELFGHEKGSFTGAIERRIGKFELANKGTLFLDEIGEVSPEMQVKLLRAIQEKEIERIGGNSVIKTDVRIIAASNRDLKKEVETGRFRRDLFYRLNVFPITLPPLRERTEDIPMLAAYFMNKYAQKTGTGIKSISATVVNELMRYEWPGNVRELEHLIERSVLMTKGDVITEVGLPQYAVHDPLEPEGPKSLEENERAFIVSILKKTHGRIRGAGGAAEVLGIPPTTLHSKMKKLGIRKMLS